MILKFAIASIFLLSIDGFIGALAIILYLLASGASDLRGLLEVFRWTEAAFAAGASSADAETLVEVVCSGHEEVGSLAVAVQNSPLLPGYSSVCKSDI